jgi:hypothetical protein
MILNENNMSISLRDTWLVLAKELDKLGYNINVSSGVKGATVLEKESGNAVGEVTREMIDEEEINYILFSRLNLKKIDVPMSS